MRTACEALKERARSTWQSPSTIFATDSPGASVLLTYMVFHTLAGIFEDPLEEYQNMQSSTVSLVKP